MRSNRTPRICLVTPEFPPQNRGGLARTVARVARLAAASGIETHIAHLVVVDGPPPLLDRNRATRQEEGLVIHNIEVGAESPDPAMRQRWDCGHTLTLRMMYESLARLHQDMGFRLWHAFFLFPMGYVTGLLARRSGTPCLTTMVGDDFNRFVFSPAKLGALTAALHSADRVVALSREMAAAADTLTPLGPKIRVIHNSVEPVEQGWSPRPPSGGPFRVGCAGFFKYSKGLPYLLAAVSRLRKERPVELELLGGFKRGQREQLDFWARETGMAQALRLIEPGDHARVINWLRTLDAFALPSLSEGCPNILMEAMACGLPCVATRVGACPELMEDGVSGRLVPPGDSAALALALARLMDAPQAAAGMGARAREAMRRFSPERERGEWLSLYGEMLDK
jgi:glycosyltransferase involved in cell wall biosynthesis